MLRADLALRRSSRSPRQCRPVVSAQEGADRIHGDRWRPGHSRASWIAAQGRPSALARGDVLGACTLPGSRDRIGRGVARGGRSGRPPSPVSGGWGRPVETAHPRALAALGVLASRSTRRALSLLRVMVALPCLIHDGRTTDTHERNGEDVTVSAPITVGVLAPISGGFYYGGVLSGITREVAAVGGHVVFFQTTDAGGADVTDGGAPDFTTPTAWNRVDGIVSVAAAAGVDYLRRLKDAGIPVVLTSNVIPGFDAPTAMPDNAGGARAAVEHLIEHGHTRIGFAGNLKQSDMRERYESYQETLIAHGLEPDPSYIFIANNNVEIGGREVANTLMAVS